MLQWTEEKQALLDIQKAAAAAWRMNRGQLYSYCERLRQDRPRILPGRLGSGFVMLLGEIADMENGAKTKIWAQLMHDTEKMLNLLQQQQDRQAWLRALPRLERQQERFFRTKLGDSFICALKENLGLQIPEAEADDYIDKKECGQISRLRQSSSKKMILSQQQELEKVAAWLMEDEDKQRAGKRKNRGRHSAKQEDRTKRTKRFGILLKQQYADILDRTVIAALACASLCLLSIWLYGQVERNQNFWDAQRMKAAAAKQQDAAGSKQGAEAGDDTDSRGRAESQDAKSRNSQDTAADEHNQVPADAVTAGGQDAAADRQAGRGSGKRPKILQQYREMAKEYPGLFGWLQIPDTQINLPVMQPFAEQNFYLDHDFTGAESVEGALFVDPKNSRWPQDNNIVVYGHNMKNGHIFGTLNLYEDENYFMSHKEIHFDTIYETGVYEAVAVLKTRILNENEQGFRYYQFFGYENEEEFRQCLDFVKANQLFDTGRSLQYKDQILMLSTCEYSQTNGRLVVVARKK